MLRRVRMRLTLLGLLGAGLLAGGIAHAQTCDDSALNDAVPPAAGAPRGDVMVIVNDNSPASCAVALAYARSRGLGSFNLVHVRTPTNYSIDWKQFRLLRDQILHSMQQKLLQSNPGVTLASCTGTDINPDPNGAPYAAPYYYCQDSVQQLNQMLGVRYVVTTMGVPSQLSVNINDKFQTQNPAGHFLLPTSLDNHLRFQLARYYPARIVTYTSVIDSSTTILQYDQRSADLQKGIDTGYLDNTAEGGKAEFRKIDPAQEGRLAVGRIDGITVEAAKQMIIRTQLAEGFGVSGKFYQSSTPAPWNSNFLAKWPLGVFDVRGAPCANINDTDFYLNVASAKTPVDCLVQYTRPVSGVGLALSSSKQPQPDSALLYEGMLDGQPSVPGTFTGILNWRRQPGPACPNNGKPLCSDPALSPAQQTSCRNQSMDAMKEINTQCVGVNRGFVGFNLQSYPMANFSVWPTGWELNSSADNLNSPAFPRVRDDDGVGAATHSLWVGNDIVSNYTVSQPVCYQGALIDDAAHTVDCVTAGLNNRPVSLSSILSVSQFPGGVLPVVATPTSSGGQPLSFTVSFDFKSEFVQGVPDLNLVVSVNARRKINPDGSNDNPRSPSADMRFPPTSIQVTDAQGNPVANNSTSVVKVKDLPGQWLHATLAFDIDPDKADLCGAACAALPCAPNCRSSYNWNGVSDRMRLTLQSDASLKGKMGLTNISVAMNGAASPNELIVNGRFDRGYQQVSTGDHAAVFLNRLGGSAFFGSIGHYDTGGHSFDGDQDRIFRSFLRGLPLGDAVWTDRGVNAALYGDPLYSPLAIRLEGSSGMKRAPEGLMVDKRVSQNVGLKIAAINGRGIGGATSYAVDVCAGGTQPLDFYGCDQAGLWNDGGLSSGIFGQGGQENIAASLDVSQWPEGWYTLRLRVTKSMSTGPVVFNDFLTFKLHSGPLQIQVDANAQPGGTGFFGAPFNTLSAAYAAALPGDYLQLAAGNYTAPPTLQNKALVISGAGSALTHIDQLNISDWNTSQPLLISDVGVGQIHLQNVSGLNFYNVRTGGLELDNASVQMDSCLLASGIEGASSTVGISVNTGGQNVTLNSCTIAGFTTGISAAGATTIHIRNSILDNDTNLSVSGATVNTAYTLFSARGSDSATWAAIAGSHNLKAKPRFWNVSGGDYRLWPDSPAINRGDPASYYFNEPACSWPVLDLGFYGNTPQATCPRSTLSLEPIILLLLD